MWVVKKQTTILFFLTISLISVLSLLGILHSETNAAPQMSLINKSPEGLTAVEWKYIQGQIMASLSITEQVKLHASDGAANDQFGVSVAVDGDTAVIGANGDSNGNSHQHSGSAYVFVRSGTSWIQQAKLTASDLDTYDFFGKGVAIDDDTIVIGAAGNDDNGSASGSAYVFTRSGTTWTEQAKLTASNAEGGDLFGTSVAILGDIAIIGAYVGDNDAGIESGAAYVFTRSGTTWSEQTKLTASDAGTFDQFGISVAMSGNTAIIGANYKSTRSGAAYIFTRSGTTWSQQAKLIASDTAPGSQFGESVALLGDTAVVGAQFDDRNGNNSGAAYIFTRSGTSWSEQTKLIPENIAASDEFGISVALSEDLVVVGSRFGDGSIVNSGSAHIFTRSGDFWNEHIKLIASDPTLSDQFGSYVAIDSDTIMIGAWSDDDLATNSGAVYVFPSTHTHELTAQLTGSGSGYISGIPIGIHCEFDCSETYEHGMALTLTATADIGSDFLGWSGDCTGQSDCLITMDTTRSVTATFNLETYNLNISLTGSGSGFVNSEPVSSNCITNCSKPYDFGTVVTLTATPDIGSSFTGWGGACIGSNECVITMTETKHVTATFMKYIIYLPYIMRR